MKSNLTKEDQKKIGLYLIFNEETAQGYVGSGILQDRQRCHTTLLNTGKHFNRKLQAAYNANPNFEFVAVPVEIAGEQFENKKEERLFASEMEDALIKEYWNDPNLLNLSKSGFKCRPEFTEEQKEIQREATKKLWEDPAYREKVSAGIRQTTSSQEYRQRKSEIAKAALSQPETVERKSATTTALWKDPEYREKVSTAVKESITPELRAARSAISKEYHNREEVKQATSQHFKTLFQDEEYRKKQLDRMQIYNQERSKTVVVNGTEYPSLREASRQTGLARLTIRKMQTA